MSTTLSTNAMITRLKYKTALGLTDAAALDYLNEAFRKVNQMSKGGFIWQLKRTTVTIAAGAQVATALPIDFDSGKSAFLYGAATVTPTDTLIPYKTPGEFANEQNFQTTGIGAFSSWTFYPNFTFGPPTAYNWTLRLAPDAAFPLVAPLVLGFYYHAVNFAPFAQGNNVYFPTPDQFDSMIVDLAIAEVRNVYRMSGGQEELGLAMQAIAEVIDTYRTDRYNLAGISDQMAQAQEKQFEGSK